MQLVRIHNLTRPENRPILAGNCRSFLCRLRGLMFRRSLAEDEGLLLVQPRSDRMDAGIHMLFMNFDIAAVWIDEHSRVVDVVLARRWRPAYIPSRAARYVLEAHPSRCTDFQVGDQLAIEPC